MLRLSVRITLALAFTAHAAAFAQPAFHRSERNGEQTSQVAPGSLECGPNILTHSTSLAIEADNSVSCNDNLTKVHTENSYYRAFVLSDFGFSGNFQVCTVRVGIEVADAGDPATTQPMTVNLYSGPPGFPTGFPGSFPNVGTASVNVGDQALTLLDVVVSGTALSGQELVVEILTPNGSPAGHVFFIGSNNNGEDDPSYLRAPDCGVNSPTATGSLGFPDMHIVMNVLGVEIPLTATPTPTVTLTSTVTPTSTPTATPTATGTPSVLAPTAPEVPTLSSVGQALMALVMLGLGIAILSRRRV